MNNGENYFFLFQALYQWKMTSLLKEQKMAYHPQDEAHNSQLISRCLLYLLLGEVHVSYPAQQDKTHGQAECSDH